MLRRLLPIALLLPASVSPAATLVVDGAAAEAPHRTIQSALDAAQPGDTIQVRPGVYRERVKFKTGGTAEAPITLSGEPGAIIDGSTDVKLEWQAMPDVAPGVYRAPVEFTPFTVTAEGKIVTMLDERRVDPAKQHDERDSLRWPKLFKDGGPKAGWNGFDALALYRVKEKDLLIRLKGDLDPAKLAITVAPKEPAITIRGAGYCVVRGFTIRNAPFAVMIEDSAGSVVEGCVLGPADYGVHLGRGSENCAVRGNEITFGPYTPSDPWREELWDNWEAHKNGGFYDRYAVRVTESKGGHEIAYNDIHDHWDGVETGWPGTPEQNGGLKVHHNRFHNIFDDAIETSSGQAGNQFYANYFENARIAIRIKGPQSGPLYIYRNVFYKNKSDMTIFWNKNDNIPPTELWVYHNTCTSDVAIGTNYRSSKPVTMPNFRFYNNLFWCASTLLRSKDYPLPDWKSEHNLFLQAGGAAARPWPTENVSSSAEGRAEKWNASLEQAKRAGIDQQSIWLTETPPGFVDAAAGNLALGEDSPARAKGLDLSKDQPHALPGCEPGYFKGERPDIGALQFGETMPKVGPAAALGVAVK
jgi:hypothetical protein